jgi:hypothetical protein
VQAARKTTRVGKVLCWAVLGSALLAVAGASSLPMLCSAVLWVLFPMGYCQCAGAQWLLLLTDCLIAWVLEADVPPYCCARRAM